MRFSIPRFVLPDNKIDRRRLLDEYFPSGLIPYEQLVDGTWQIDTFIPDCLFYYTDPSLERSLENWYEVVPIKNLHHYWRIYKHAMLSFSDAWSAFYWSSILKWIHSRGKEIQRIVLFHIDDHTDQDPLLLVHEDQQFECVFTKRTVDFSIPQSIQQAIEIKSINIRSFITLLLHSVPSVQICHLKYAYQGEPKKHGLLHSFGTDQILAFGKKRPYVCPIDHHTPHLYLLDSHLNQLLQTIDKDSLIFLHIDCDGFNNRYNGDSLWDKKKPSIDLNLVEIKKRIHEIISKISLLSDQVYLNLALSPDFFPSEYWKEVTQYVFECAQQFGLFKNEELSEYLKNLYPNNLLHETF